MALVTRCPGCSTTFRVNAAQLQAHGGEVRCGHCQRVFNGFATLITVHESAIEYPVAIQPQPFSEPGSTIEPYTVTPHPNRSLDSPVVSGREQERTDISDRLFDAEEPVKPSLKIWALASVFMLFLLSGQMIHVYRTELAMIAPETRPYLERYCEFMNCIVPYPQNIQLLGIESSELQKNPARQPEITTLHAIIRNHAPFPQAFPALHLLLLDAQQQVIASRIFTAQDYLPEQDKALTFLEPQQEIDVRLDFDSTHLNALGYRLLLLYI